MAVSVWFVAVVLTWITGETGVGSVVWVVSMVVPSGGVLDPLSKIIGPLAVF
jgi:hypothetical protein